VTSISHLRESLNKLTFSNGDYVILVSGMNQGVKEGDLLRDSPDSDTDKVSWFKWQPKNW